MKAILITKPNEIKMIEVPCPTIQNPDSVLVKIKATGICGSDVHVLHGTNPYAKYPIVPGHEAAGEIVEIGANVNDLKIGDGVVFEPITYCGTCYACKHEQHNVCKELSVLGCSVDGTFREYAVVPRSQVYKFDKEKISYIQAAACEPYTIGFQAASRACIHEGDLVLIHGAGPIGLILCDVAKHFGAKVIVSEPQQQRLEIAKIFGADYLVNPKLEKLDEFIMKLTHGEGVNVVFETAGIPVLMQQAVEILSPAGRFVPLTFGKEPIPLNFKAINAKELSILGTRHQYMKFPIVVKFIETRLDKVNILISNTYPAEEFETAFDLLNQKASNITKVILTF